MMFIEILIFSLFGTVTGLLCGLLPGVHPNNLLILIMALLPLLSGYPIQAMIGFIISMVVVNTITSFIPSIFLGSPDDSTALSVLPGHRFLLEGRGLEAILLSVTGGLGVVILFILMIPLLLKILPVLYSSIKYYTHWLLSAIVLVMIITEQGFKRKLWGLLAFLLAGILGLITLNSTILQPQWVFFPLFSGLFGISTLLISLKDKTKIPKQVKEFGVVNKSLALWGIVKGFFSGLIVGILPGVGAAQASTLVQQITRKENTREFLVSLGGINTANTIFALTALYAIGRPRSGAAVAVERILGGFSFNDLILLIAVTLFVTGIAVPLTLLISKKFLFLLEKIPYQKVSIGTILFLVILTAFFTGWTGLIVLFVSTAIGLIPPLTGVKRSLCMGVLILPVIFYYSGITL